MTPQENQQVDDRAKKTIQEVTGTPAMQLRGLTPQDAIANFVAQQMSAPSVSLPPQSTEVTSTITFPPASGMINTNEQPISPPGGGGGGSTGTPKQVIIDDNGTLNYYNISADFVGPV